MISRRNLLVSAVAGVAGATLTGRRAAASTPAPEMRTRLQGRTPVLTPDVTPLPWRMENGVKVFHLIAEPVKREFAPGFVVNCWGYNGQVPGPTIEAVEGDRVRIYVTNNLPEGTSIHWHGIILPAGMDGVSGLNQPKIGAGETWAYEFTLKQSGTQMYHPHFDEMVQLAMGMKGFFVIHPKDPNEHRVDRDFAIFLDEWAIKPGTATPDPTVMLDFNMFTFNGRSFPATSPLIVRKGDRVRIRLANLTMDSHPIHIHGHNFRVTGTDGGPTPFGAQSPETTVNVPVGTTRDVEFVADNPGDWAFHCHKSHHTMNQMGHGLPNLIGVDYGSLETKVGDMVPGAMLMGAEGMGGMTEHMTNITRNSLAMGGGYGPFGPIEMGGMLTVIKIRERLGSYEEDPGWYEYPDGTRAWKVEAMSRKVSMYVCPMHPEVTSALPGRCPKCGMELVPRE